MAVDLYCGLGGWTDGLLAEGYDVIGFDIEQHVYGEHRYPAHLVIQDVRTLHGSQFRDATLIVASPPCQEYSYMAMPWSRAKALAADYRSGRRDVRQLTALFDACFRIQREASEAAGRHIPLVVENVRGAIPWVGRSRWNFGSFHLWGDVPALMPFTNKNHHKIESPHLHLGDPRSAAGSVARQRFEERRNGQKVPGFRFDGSGRSFQSASVEGVKNKDSDGYERNHPNAFGWKAPRTSSGAGKRKMASAMIAKIPLPLSRHIARAWLPQREAA